MREIPELYEIAKRITLDAGFPYTDPRTLETTQPMPKNNKTPKWILFDQIHVDVNIKSDMPEKERKELRALLNSKPMMSLFESIISGPHRDKIQVKVSR
jgi:hypothetical protein